jgi:hypothetical protein
MMSLAGCLGPLIGAIEWSHLAIPPPMILLSFSSLPTLLLLFLNLNIPSSDTLLSCELIEAAVAGPIHCHSPDIKFLCMGGCDAAADTTLNNKMSL